MATTRISLRDLADLQSTNDFTRRIVASLIDDGVIPTDIPWGDPRFQDMLLAGIGKLRKYKVEADKLAVIREVFGGQK